MEEIRGSSSDDKFDKLIMSKRSHIDGLTFEKQRLIDLYQSGAISLAEIEPRLEDIRRRMKQFEDELNLIQRQQQDRKRFLTVVEDFKSFSNSVDVRLDRMEPEQIKAVMKLLIQEVRVNNETHEIEVDHILSGIMDNCGLRTDSLSACKLV